MKYLNYPTLALTLSLTLFACGSKNETAATGAAGANSTPAVEESTGEEVIVEVGPDTTIEEEAEVVETEAPTPTKQRSKKSFFSAFKSRHCFLNRLASEGMGEKIFTRAAIEFRKNGTGRNAFRLYADENCEKEIARGVMKFTYKIAKRYENIFVIEIEQQNSDNPKDTSTFWLTAMAHKNGLLIDIDYRNENAGAYAWEPSEKEMQSFLENSKRGVLFQAIRLKSNHK